MIWQILGIIGAAMCLVAYWMIYKPVLTPLIPPLNAAGSGLLLAVSIHRGDVGFIILNVFWLTITVVRFWPRRDRYWWQWVELFGGTRP